MVTQRTYQASLSQSQGRSGYSVIFRHPVRNDDATGKPGLRVRRGLRTRDVAEAECLRDELNILLAESRYHSPTARPEAERRFDPRVVGIFYDGVTPEPLDFVALRDNAIPLPPSGAEGHRRVLLLGTTGAGKTTLVRQLIGTDPKTERFPSTSTAKTTVHDTEIVLDRGGWRAAVTFYSSDEVREYLTECISAAALAAARGASDSAVLRQLLNHVNQRFRFSYLLGNGPLSAIKEFEFDEEDETGAAEEVLTEEEAGAVDLTATNKLLTETVGRLRDLGTTLADQVRNDLDPGNEQDKRVAEELFEEELDNLLRDEEAFHEIADNLMDTIEGRFELLPPGEVKKTKQGWPLIWTGEWPVEKRVEFVRAISRFSSNYAPHFGRLLTPLVSGMRVAGPFVPEWHDGSPPQLALLDGEGLGHTPKSSSAVPTGVSRRIEAADAIVLVDNATQPMQAASVAAMREIVATGHARKLVVVFTHFDEVKGDNLRGAEAKAQHVLASAENVLPALGEELGPYAERALRSRLEDARFFVAGIHEPLAEDTAQGRRTVKQLQGLLDAIDRVTERPKAVEAHPVYDRMNLVLAVHGAATAFHGTWRPLLGLEYKPGLVKEHWARVKALSRRLATGMADEYASLRPVADLRKELAERIYVFVQNPLRWDGSEPSEEQKQQKYDAIAEAVSRRLRELANRRVWTERIGGWQEAYDKRGSGSTFVRARIIGDDIYAPAAPVPDVIPSPDRNQFLHEVVEEIEAAAEDVGARLT